MTNIHFHLLEIKARFFYLIISTLSTFLIFYNYKIEIVYLIGRPFLEFQQTFIFLELTEAFYTLLRISGIFTFLVLVPFIVYHFWSFLIPSFYKMERKKINFFVVFFFCIFLCEILVTYFAFLPKICHFLLSFEITSNLEKSEFHLDPLISVEFSARIESYVFLIVKVSSMIFLVFQIPLSVYFMCSKGLLNVSSFSKNRKILCLISLLLSAFLVPPDLITQLVVTVFFLILFEFSIFIGLLIENPKNSFLLQ